MWGCDGKMVVNDAQVFANDGQRWLMVSDDNRWPSMVSGSRFNVEVRDGGDNG